MLSRLIGRGSESLPLCLLYEWFQAHTIQSVRRSPFYERTRISSSGQIAKPVNSLEPCWDFLFGRNYDEEQRLDFRICFIHCYIFNKFMRYINYLRKTWSSPMPFHFMFVQCSMHWIVMLHVLYLNVYLFYIISKPVPMLFCSLCYCTVQRTRLSTSFSILNNWIKMIPI